MILVDTSCWVEFYRPAGSPGIQAAVRVAVESHKAAVCGVVRVELLGYIARDAEYAEARGDFEALHDLGIVPGDFECAVEIGRTLRSLGLTVPAPDLIIAAVALRENAVLLHSDRHFETIAAHLPLRTQYVPVATA